MRLIFAGFIFLLTPVAAIAAGDFDCREYSNQKGTQYGGRETIAVTTSSQGLGRDYFSTGGNCKTRVLGGEGSGIIETAERTDGEDGFSCTARASSPTTFIEITATMWACKLNLPTPDISKRPAQFTNYGLGGNTVVIARAMKGPIPFGVRVCNLDPRTHIAVEIGAQNPISLDPAKCLVLDRPAQVYFRTDQNVDRDVHGAYRLFPSGDTRQKPRIELATKPFVGVPIDIADPHQAIAECKARQPGDGVNDAYWGVCKLDALKDGKAYRVCFDTGYTNQGADKLEYPGSLLPMVLDKAKLGDAPVGGQLSNYFYNVIASGDCRDLFGVTEAFILVTFNNWNEQAVNKITYRFAEIPAAK